MQVAACRHAGANDLLGRLAPFSVRRCLSRMLSGYCFGIGELRCGQCGWDAALVDKFHDVLERGACAAASNTIVQTTLIKQMVARWPSSAVSLGSPWRICCRPSDQPEPDRGRSLALARSPAGSSGRFGLGDGMNARLHEWRLR